MIESLFNTNQLKELAPRGFSEADAKTPPKAGAGVAKI